MRQGFHKAFPEQDSVIEFKDAQRQTKEINCGTATESSKTIKVCAVNDYLHILFCSSTLLHCFIHQFPHGKYKMLQLVKLETCIICSLLNFMTAQNDAERAWSDANCSSLGSAFINHMLCKLCELVKRKKKGQQIRHSESNLQFSVHLFGSVVLSASVTREVGSLRIK